MAKPEWGTKRECAECATRFYDLNREPIACPSCEAIFVIEAPKPPPKPRPKSTGPVKPTPIVEDDPKETKDDEAELLKTAGIEEDDSDDSEEDGVVGDVFVEDDDEEDDVTNVLDAPVAKPTNE